MGLELSLGAWRCVTQQPRQLQTVKDQGPEGQEAV